jgi:hypothetical protein
MYIVHCTVFLSKKNYHLGDGGLCSSFNFSGENLLPHCKSVPAQSQI